VYAEQSECEIDFDGSDPIEREIYQIFLNIWEGWKAHLDCWARQEQVCTEVPQQEATETRSLKTRSRQQLHVGMLQRAREEATRGRASRR